MGTLTLNAGALKMGVDSLRGQASPKALEAQSAARETSRLEDQRLVELAQAGDQEAFGELVSKYSTPIYRLMLRYLRNDADAQDAAQTAFVKAWMAIGKFRGDARFFTWLYRISLNVARSAAQVNKSKWSHVPLEDEEDLPHIEDSSVQDTELTSAERIVAEELEKLPGSIRDAFCFRELQGYSYLEIAEIMDCPIGTVRSRIFRARAALEQAIRGMEE